MWLVLTSMTPTMSALSSGSPTSFQTAHSCSCCGLARLDVDELRARAQDDVDDLAQPVVLVVRAAVVPPADVVAELLGRHVGQDVVEHVDAGGEVGGRIGQVAALDRAVERHRRVGRVELQVEPGVHDRVVLGRQRRGGGLDVLLVGRVVVVGEVERDVTGRHGGHERVRRGGRRARPRSRRSRGRPRPCRAARSGRRGSAGASGPSRPSRRG